MFFRVQDSLARTIHDYRCKGILDTEPLHIVRSGLTILSMVRHRDVIMYLVAIKSLYKRLGHGQVVIIDDGTLTVEDRALINHHTLCRCLHIKKVETGSLPKGGTWERLSTAVELSRDSYVIQVDSDTVTRGDISEVKDCVDRNRSFTLGTDKGRSFVSLREATALALASNITPHVQDQAEMVLSSLPDADRTHYVRGCSGFAGFARGAHDFAALVSFSAAMADRIGMKWAEWGSEQVASNYMIANSEGATVLPTYKYINFNRHVNPKRSAFVHFIGTDRFYRGIYASESRLAFSSAQTAPQVTATAAPKR